MEDKEIWGEWEAVNFSKNHYEVHLKGSTPYVIVASGTPQTKQIQIPFAHRLVKLVLRQMNSSNVDTIAPLAVSLTREEGEMRQGALFRDRMYDRDEPSTWTLTLAGWDSNRVVPILYIQRLER